MVSTSTSGSSASSSRPPASRSQNSPYRLVRAIVRSCSRWPVGQLVVQFAGLRVDQIRGEGAGVASEQGVGQRHVSPEEADQVQPSEQHDHRVDQPVDRVLAYAAAEQRPVRQRELQMPRDQDRVQRLAVPVDPVGDHPNCLDRRNVQPGQVAEQPVLVQGQMLQHLLEGVDLLADPDEATTCREMPRGRATRSSSGQSSNGVAQGSVINRASGCAAQNLGIGVILSPAASGINERPPAW